MNISVKPITGQDLSRYLAIADLTQSDKSHAVKLVYERVLEKIRSLHPDSEVRVHREDPIVAVKDNYDRLLIDPNNVTRSSTYTHYVDETHVLRTHTSAHMPGLLRELAGRDDWHDVVILLPGLAYRRDVSDRQHLGEVQMLDIWRVRKTTGETPDSPDTARKSNGITREDLLETVQAIAEAAAPGWQLRIVDNPHPYTSQGIEVNAVSGDRDIEILECGLINKKILAQAGLDPVSHSGWALGMGLDRLVMTLKGISDIRYLRSHNPKIAEQMTTLDPYHEVSDQPAIRRDLSYSVPEEYVEEDISADIRGALGEQREILESVEILTQTNYSELPEVARKRLGCREGQKNVLVRITLRHLERSITNEEANQLYQVIYHQVNKGDGGYH